MIPELFFCQRNYWRRAKILLCTAGIVLIVYASNFCPHEYKTCVSQPISIANIYISYNSIKINIPFICYIALQMDFLETQVSLKQVLFTEESFNRGMFVFLVSSSDKLGLSVHSFNELCVQTS